MDEQFRDAQSRRWPLVLCWGYAAASLLLVVAWMVVGDAWWLQPFNLTTFWWTLPGLVLAPVAAVFRRWGMAAAFAVPGLVFVWSYGTLFLPSSPPDLPPDLTVASFNTYVQTPDGSHVIDLVDQVDPDVLLLQEVFPPLQAELEESLADRLPHTMTVQSEGVGGVMVASRYPIVEERPITAGVDDVRATAVAVLDVDGQLVQVVPVHLRSPCPTCGPSMTDRLRLEGESREAEMATVLGALDGGTPAVVGGDFNSNERSAPYRSLTSAGFHDVQREAGAGPGFTWPNDDRLPVPAFRVDWLLSRGLVPVDAWVDSGGPSDHRPVVGVFAFEED